MDFDKTVRTTFPQMREKNICSRSFLSELLMIGRTICVLRYSSKSFDFTRVFFKLKCAGLIRSEKPRQLRVLLSDGGINNVSEAFLNPVRVKKHWSGNNKSTTFALDMRAAPWNCDLETNLQINSVLTRRSLMQTDDVFSDSGARNSSLNDRTWRQH